MDFGDGSSITNGQFVQHFFADDGTYLVRVTVSDGDGASDAATVSVTINNALPVITRTLPRQTSEGQLLSIVDIATFTDLGFNNAALGTTEAFTFSIDWGDGSPLNIGAATTDVVGSAGTPTRGSFDGSHTYADDGTYTVTLIAMDDNGGSATATFPVIVTNIAPTLVAASEQTIHEGSALTLDSIAAFTDPGFINPARGTSESFSFLINWGDGSPVETGNAAGTTSGGPGMLTAGSFGGSHFYADDGLYTVTVSVTDDDGASATQTLLVHVQNVAPTIVLPATLGAIDEGRLFRLDQSFADPGADRWMVTVDYLGNGQFVPAVRDGKTFRLARVYNLPGVYPLTVKVRDDEGAEGTAAIDVTVNDVVVPQSPFIENPISPLVVDEDAAPIANYANMNGVFQDSDTPDSELTFSLVSNTHSSLVKATLEANDTLDLSFIPNGFGAATITLRATDPEGNSVTHSFTVEVRSVNDAPTVDHPIANKTATAYHTLQVSLPDDVFVDEDGDTISLSAGLRDNLPLPSWLSFDPQTSEFHGIPDNAQAGALEIIVTATDTGTPPRTATSTFTITVLENLHPHQNPLDRFDINGDGTVVPIDVLVLINYLNNVGVGPLAPPANGIEALTMFVDPTGDNIAAPFDALVVINFLNGLAGEGESALPEIAAQDRRNVAPDFVFARVGESVEKWRGGEGQVSRARGPWCRPTCDSSGSQPPTHHSRLSSDPRRTTPVRPTTRELFSDGDEWVIDFAVLEEELAEDIERRMGG